jgi:hypothetical protein
VTHREADLTRLRTVPIGHRENRVELAGLAGLPVPGGSFQQFFESLPDALAARSLRAVVEGMVAATQQKKAIVVLLGAHVVKVGLGPVLIELMRRGAITHLAFNGAAAIHDFELAAFGGTSENVAAGLADGTFGMAEETGHEMNAAVIAAAARDQGLGEGLCLALVQRDALPGGAASLLVAAQRLKLGATVHLTIGADIIHVHPTADGGALGATSHRDFRRLAGTLPDLHEGGVVLNLGSAVVMPEVFLKALTVARNLSAGRPTHFLAADFDMQRHYRPRMNVVQRPTLAGGAGFEITGHHEILLPLLAWAVIDRLDAR